MYALYLIVLYLSIATIYSTRVRKSSYKKDMDQDWLDWSTNRYKIPGVTKNGHACIDNCVDGFCLRAIDYAWGRQACNVTENTNGDLVYFTTRYQHKDKFVCLTLCGKFGYPYEWCLVTKDGAWDYCSTEVYRGTYNVHLTTDTKTRCKSPCDRLFTLSLTVPSPLTLSVTAKDGKYVCKDSWNVPRECNPDVTEKYIPKRSVYGDLCITPCLNKAPKDGWWGYRCNDIKGHVKSCAPPARRFGNHTKEIYYRLHPLGPRSGGYYGSAYVA